jgi:hypothetical protein
MPFIKHGFSVVVVAIVLNFEEEIRKHNRFQFFRMAYFLDSRSFLRFSISFFNLRDFWLIRMSADIPSNNDDVGGEASSSSRIFEKQYEHTKFPIVFLVLTIINLCV